ncbi:MAG: RNA-binding protein [Lachnospiraceae bacterium]|nr:RNA-binding protein [Lachnospiraceae bacterium]
MFYLGRIQKVTVAKIMEHGAYLANAEEKGFDVPENEQIDVGTVLLPRKEAVLLSVGEPLSVFVYKDSEDRPIATRTVPKLTMGEVKRLTVRDVSSIGAFLDWGLLKDLFLPFKEQTYRVKNGDEVLVSLYTDKSSRLCATMKVYKFLKNGSPYKKDDVVTGLCYDKIEAFGSYIAVDDIYSALIPKHRLFTEILPGMQVTANVVNVHEDGRLELSVTGKAYNEIDGDAEKILEALNEAGGFLPYHDKTSPDIIIAKFGISKNAFKRAIGHLQKNGKIFIYDNGIEKVGR